MRTRVALLFLIFFNSFLFSQKNISNSNFNVKFLEHLIKIKVDSVRAVYNCKTLVNDSILYLASQHHARYMRKNQKLSHYEPDSITKTSQLRAEYYGAKHYGVGENILKTGYNAVIKTKHKKFINTSTYEGLAKAIVVGWVNSPGHFKNIITPEYQITGVAIDVDTLKNTVYACQVFAHVQYKYSFTESKQLFPYSKYKAPPVINSFKNIPDKLLTHKHDWGLKHNNLNKCIRCEKIMENKPFFTLRYEKRNFILRIENTDYVKQLIRHKYDGFAVEIVEFDDYMCGNPNYYIKPSRRNKQCRLNGKVLQPLYRNDLYKGYKHRMKKQHFSFVKYILGADSVKFFERFYRYKIEKYNSEYFEIKLGKLPKNITGYWNHNLVYIQDKQICGIEYFTNYCGEIFEQYQQTKFIFPNPKTDYRFKLDTQKITFTIPFEKQKYIIDSLDIKQKIYPLKNIKYTIDSITVTAYSSVEGNEEINKKLQTKRAQSIIDILNQTGKLTAKTKINVYADWEHFYTRIRASKKWQFLVEYDKAMLQKVINEKYADSLEYIFEKERRAEVRLIYTVDLTDENLEYYILKEQKIWIDSLSKLKNRQDTSLAQALSGYEKFYAFVHNKVIEGKVDTAVFANLSMPQEFFRDTTLYQQYLLNGYEFPEYFKNNAEWVNYAHGNINDLVFKNDSVRPGLMNEFLYNYCKITTDELITQKNVLKEEVNKVLNVIRYVEDYKNPRKELQDGFEKIKMNLYYIMLNKVYGKEPVKYSSNAKWFILKLTEIYKSQQKYNDTTAFSLAKMAVHFNLIELAVNLLEPYFNQDNILEYALPLLYQHNSFDTQNDFYSFLLEKHETMDEVTWCNLFFDKCGIPFQVFDNERVRNVFCEKCLDKNRWFILNEIK